MDTSLNSLITFFRPYVPDEILHIRDLSHKGNNRLYRVSLPGRDVLLKHYSAVQSVAPNEINQKGRGESEFKALNFLHIRGISDVPLPIKFYPEENIGIYSFEQGRTLSAEEVSKEDIFAAADFLSKLHMIKGREIQTFPPARSACLSLTEYGNVLNFRLQKLRVSENPLEELANAKKFLEQKVVPGISRLQNYYSEEVLRRKIPPAIAEHEQVLTPGDFGFHNIIVNREMKKYCFLDFEYFGRDDPVRQVLDFIHHDRSRNISPLLKQQFIERYRANTLLDPYFEERFNLLDPVVGATWVLIYLNILSPEYRSHISFAHGETNTAIRQRQEKAETKWSELLSSYPRIFKD